MARPLKIAELDSTEALVRGGGDTIVNLNLRLNRPASDLEQDIASGQAVPKLEIQWPYPGQIRVSVKVPAGAEVPSIAEPLAFVNQVLDSAASAADKAEARAAEVDAAVRAAAEEWIRDNM